MHGVKSHDAKIRILTYHMVLAVDGETCHYLTSHEVYHLVCIAKEECPCAGRGPGQEQLDGVGRVLKTC